MFGQSLDRCPPLSVHCCFLGVHQCPYIDDLRCQGLRDELHLAKFLVPALFDRPRLALTHRDYNYIDKLNSQYHTHSPT